MLGGDAGFMLTSKRTGLLRGPTPLAVMVPARVGDIGDRPDGRRGGSILCGHPLLAARRKAAAPQGVLLPRSAKEGETRKVSFPQSI